MNFQRMLMLFISITPIILAGLIWNLSVDNSSSHSETTLQTDDLPDSVINELTYRQFDLDGNLIQQLETSNAVSRLAGEEIALQQPQLRVTSNDQTEWTASSLSGYLDRPGSQLVLEGDVELHRLGNRPAQLLTESLIWLPTSASAYTNDLVVIDSSGNHIESRGISIDLDRSNFIFHSEVRGTHEPL